MLVAGLGGAARHGCVALSDDRGLLAVCEQERATRTRGAGFNAATGMPDEALDLLLERHGLSRPDVRRYVSGEPLTGGDGHRQVEVIDHHFAHACTSFLTSPFSAAAVLICDREAPKVSVWEATSGRLSRIDWPWDGPGLVDVYSRCAAVLGFHGEGGGQRLEALARLWPGAVDERWGALLTLDGHRLGLDPRWEAVIEDSLGEAAPHPGLPPNTMLAAALQRRVGELFLDLLTRIRRHTQAERLCLGGSLFYHSSINTLARQSGLFREVFVPVDPGNAGLAVGAALVSTHTPSRPVRPFLGPAYTAAEIKQTLDNCKLQYAWASEDDAIDQAVRALKEGTLVAWFESGMEWGPRALGARSILANPFAPYVLENLNRFLKRREPWRGYALSGLEASFREHFDGPSNAPFMECDYRPRDPEAFAHVLPSPRAVLRAQTVGMDAPPRFERLLAAFGAQTGLPFLVNTSFNGFQEPIVCSPRDAVRVFYGTGLDALVLDQFVLQK